jgi:hypothetical protein
MIDAHNLGLLVFCMVSKSAPNILWTVRGLLTDTPFHAAGNSSAVAFAKISLQTLLERRFAPTAQPGKPLSPDLKRAFGIAPRRA